MANKNRALGRRRRFSFAEIAERVVLTAREKQVLVFVLAAFVLGLATKYYRENHPPAPVTPADLSSSDSGKSGKDLRH